jgi:hypothetical protein
MKYTKDNIMMLATATKTLEYITIILLDKGEK